MPSSSVATASPNIASLHCFGALTESKDHLVGVEGIAHVSMLRAFIVAFELVTWLFGSVLLNRVAASYGPRPVRS